MKFITDPISSSNLQLLSMGNLGLTHILNQIELESNTTQLYLTQLLSYYNLYHLWIVVITGLL